MTRRDGADEERTRGRQLAPEGMAIDRWALFGLRDTDPFNLPMQHDYGAMLDSPKLTTPLY